MGQLLRLADLLGGLSIVADLGFGLPREEAMRCCLIGTALARRLGVFEDVVADTFYTSLLVHIGCTAFSHETSAVFGDEFRNTRAVARTNFADPRDVLTRFVPEATRGMSAPSRVRAAAFIVTKGNGFGKRCETASRSAHDPDQHGAGRSAAAARGRPRRDRAALPRRPGRSTATGQPALPRADPSRRARRGSPGALSHAAPHLRRDAHRRRHQSAPTAALDGTPFRRVHAGHLRPRSGSSWR